MRPNANERSGKHTNAIINKWKQVPPRYLPRFLSCPRRLVHLVYNKRSDEKALGIQRQDAVAPLTYNVVLWCIA